MKKIFVIEINEKDKNINNFEAVISLDKAFKEFSEIINNNKNLYVRIKRVGSTWQNIKDNINNKIKNNISNQSKSDSKIKKTNHLKVVK